MEMPFAILIKHGQGWVRFAYVTQRDQIAHAKTWRDRGYTVRLESQESVALPA